MNQSEQINELAIALSKAQSEIKSAKKSSENPFFKSKYADLTEVWEAGREAICKNGLAISHTMGKDGNQLMLYTTLLHSSGQWMRSAFPIICKKPDDIQAMGSSITYTKRYNLSAILNICTDDDDDGNEGSQNAKPTNATQKKPIVPQKQPIKIDEPPLEDRERLIILLGDVLEECGMDYENKILEHYKIKNIGGIPNAELLKVINKASAYRELKMKQQESQG